MVRCYLGLCQVGHVLLTSGPLVEVSPPRDGDLLPPVHLFPLLRDQVLLGLELALLVDEVELALSVDNDPLAGGPGVVPGGGLGGVVDVVLLALGGGALLPALWQGAEVRCRRGHVSGRMGARVELLHHLLVHRLEQQSVSRANFILTQSSPLDTLFVRQQ